MSEAVNNKVKVVIAGENGAGDQVFEADSHEALVEKLRVAQENATKKIRQQETAYQELQSSLSKYAVEEEEEVVSNPDFDRQDYFNTLYQDPLAAQRKALEKVLGISVDDLRNQWQRQQLAAERWEQQSVNAAFVGQHPELLQVSKEDDLVNGQAIASILTENQWQYTVPNLEAAYQVAKANGKLKLPTPDPDPAAEVLHQVPITITRPSGGEANKGQVDEDTFLRTAPLDEVRQYLEAKQAQLTR